MIKIILSIKELKVRKIILIGLKSTEQYFYKKKNITWHFLTLIKNFKRRSEKRKLFLKLFYLKEAKSCMKSSWPGRSELKTLE